MFKRIVAPVLTTLLVASGLASTAQADEFAPSSLRIATFNASLNRSAEGELIEHLSNGDNEQARNAAETIQRANPDIILVNEFDYDENGTAQDLFRTNYLEVSQHGADPVTYPYAWSGPVNTGVPSGLDLNNDGEVGGPDDAWGFGEFPGQYGFVVYSKYPINTDDVRTFQNFLWKDMPDNAMPENWFDADEVEQVRLSSKTHADIPVQVGDETLHVLAAHPTPPSFDGPEQRNKRRNNDEIRIWADYISGKADYLYDDKGTKGGLEAGSHFAILGDYNSDPNDGDSMPGSIDQLLNHPLVLDPKPTSEGAVEAAKQGGANESHKSDPKYDTADFNDDPRPGNIRVDYTLFNAETMQVSDAGVFWPVKSDPLSRLTGEYPFPTSDHRLVWADVTLKGSAQGDESDEDTQPSPEKPDPSPDESDDDQNDAERPSPERPDLPQTGV